MNADSVPLNPLVDFTGLPRYGDWQPNDIASAIDQLLADGRAAVQRVLSAPVTWDAFVAPLEDGFTGFGRCATDAEGRFEFVTVKPGPVPGPDDRLQAPHIDVSVFARGLLNRLVTRIYFPDEAEANAGDPVLALIEDEAERQTLIAGQEDGALRFDIRLQGEGETAFFAI